jgi:hypothetical protein
MRLQLLGALLALTVIAAAPMPGRKYYDSYDYKFVTVERDAALAKVKELLGF